jgi:hypothetical protein
MKTCKRNVEFSSEGGIYIQETLYSLRIIKLGIRP